MNLESLYVNTAQIRNVNRTLHMLFFLVFVRMFNDVSHDIGSSVCARHLIHVSYACVFDPSSTLSSHSSFVSPIFYFILLKDTSSSMWIGLEQDPLCTSPNEELGTLANNAPLTGYEPKFFDYCHFTETTEIFIQESSSDTRPSYLHDSEITDDTIGRALSSPLFTQEREEPAGRRQAYHSPEVKSVVVCRSCKNGETC